MFGDEPITVSEFISFLNQTLEFAYPAVTIIGELSSFRISKNKWVYFDLKDDQSNLKFFGSVHQLKYSLEDGMLLKVRCMPRMHSNFGFSMQIQAIELVGEGSLRRAAEMLQQKLAKEGLFDESKKRSLIYPPSKVGLITSSQSAAYADFIKIINSRWTGVEINLIDVQVQGEAAIEQISYAFNHFNESNLKLDAIVLIRGGGSAEDLAAFNSEQVTRAVAGSRIPTLVAIGHEVDINLAELAADKRASTPSNAAELLVPDRRVVLSQLAQTKLHLNKLKDNIFRLLVDNLELERSSLKDFIDSVIANQRQLLIARRRLLQAYNPAAILNRGYSIVRKSGKIIKSSENLKLSDILDIQLASGDLSVVVDKLTKGN